MDEFGPLNLQPHPGRQWTERGGRHKDPAREPRPTGSGTCSPPTTWPRASSTGPHQADEEADQFLEFCRCLRSRYPPEIRIAIVLDNLSRAA